MHQLGFRFDELVAPDLVPGIHIDLFFSRFDYACDRGPPKEGIGRQARSNSQNPSAVSIVQGGFKQF
jgi:hypothetical protein